MISFIEAQQALPVTQRQNDRLNRCHQLVTHYFSLMHAIALVNLNCAEGQPVGHMDWKGHVISEEFQVVPISTGINNLVKKKTNNLKRATVNEHRAHVDTFDLGCKTGWTAKLVAESGRRLSAAACSSGDFGPALCCPPGVDRVDFFMGIWHSSKSGKIR